MHKQGLKAVNSLVNLMAALLLRDCHIACSSLSVLVCSSLNVLLVQQAVAYLDVNISYCCAKVGTCLAA